MKRITNTDEIPMQSDPVTVAQVVYAQVEAGQMTLSAYVVVCAALSAAKVSPDTLINPRDVVNYCAVLATEMGFKEVAFDLRPPPMMASDPASPSTKGGH